MSGSRRRFTPAYRREAAHLVIDTGRAIAVVAREIGVGEQLLGRWVGVERARLVDPPGVIGETDRAELDRLRVENAELRMDREFLKKAPRPSSRPSSRPGRGLPSHGRAEGHLHDQQNGRPVVGLEFGLLRLGRPAGGGPTRSQVRRTELTAKIAAFHHESDQVYGAPRILADLRDAGERVSRKTVARLMRTAGIVGISPRTFTPVTTIAGPDAAPVPDLVGRLFDRGRLDAVWTSDITYLGTDQGWLYLCAVRDGWSRRVLGWAIEDHLRTDLVQAALSMAVTLRGQLPEKVIFHADRGTQYTSAQIADAATDFGVLRSMGRTGVCWDNAPAESFWSTFKTEFYNRQHWATKADAKMASARWIEERYNRKRRHSSIGMLTPVGFEQLHNQTATAA
jgi:putative transposase